ncbi:MAG: glycosyl hydrolase [Balneolaceae bacterium]|nr:glycosyl hydrolase [Balneolaceae bacterium]
MIGSVILLGTLLLACSTTQEQDVEWPEITSENKPWTRWWWMGSTVNEQDLTERMEQYAAANIGGLEITPIYGVYGYEDQFINFLSPTWMDRLEYTLAEGDSLGLGIDMATGTGWPFGGPWIEQNHASKRLYFNTYEITGGSTVNQQISYVQEPYLSSVGNTVYELHGFLRAEGEQPKGTAEQPLRNPESDPIEISEIEQPISANENLQALALSQVRFEQELPLAALMAYSGDGEVLDISDQVDENGNLEWDAPAGSWTLYAVFDGWHGKIVERAAPGGEGFVIDHFSGEALQHYLADI